MFPWEVSGYGNQCPWARAFFVFSARIPVRVNKRRMKRVLVQITVDALRAILIPEVGLPFGGGSFHNLVKGEITSLFPLSLIS